MNSVHMFGDLTLPDKLHKIADTIPIVGDMLSDLCATFKEVVHKVDDTDLSINPSKIKILIKSANIFGIFWQRHTQSLKIKAQSTGLL